MAKNKCKIWVGDVGRRITSYPLNAFGWGSAVKKARKEAKAGRKLTTIDLVCPDGEMAVAQCSTYQGKVRCSLETVVTLEDLPKGRDPASIAGVRKKRKK